jgi:hypothetical protein
MKRIIVIGLLLGGIAICIAACALPKAYWHRRNIQTSLQQAATFEQGRLAVSNRIPILHLYGTPTEMGRQHGILFKQALQSLSAYLHALVPEATLRDLLRQAERYEPNLPAEIREEIQAMAAAAEVPYLELAAINVIPRLRCSTLAVWGQVTADGELLMGRNADYFGLGLSDRGSVIVVYHPARGKQVLAIGFLGMVGAYTGINEDGVAFGNMLVFNAAQDGVNAAGLPIQIAMRLAAQTSSTALEMCAALNGQSHLIPMNVMVADAAEALVIELGLNGNRVRADDNEVLAASNYFRSPELYRQPVNCHRYAALLDAAAAHSGKFGVADMEQALFDARMKDLNLQAVVFKPAARKMFISINRVPAAKGPYVELDLRSVFD